MQPLFRVLPHRIEQMQQLDGVSKPVSEAVSKAVRSGTPLKDLLSGTWLGEPLHPVLTDVVIGSWTSAALLDVLAGKHARKSADRLIAIGVLAAVPTAAAGLSDWAELWGGPQRVGIVHAAGNVTALLLHSMSWVARKRGRRLRGRLLSMMGMGVAVASAYLGGDLSFGKGVGVNQTAFEAIPEDWTAVLDAQALPEGKPAPASINGTPVVLYKQGAQIDAVLDRCTHRGCMLHTGEVNTDGTITCPCHGSTFRLADGQVVQGPATAPQPSFEVRVRDGKVELKPRPPAFSW